ncbi:MAG: hypothetical protein WCK57_11220 [Verrucomicrobiae bacterium]
MKSLAREGHFARLQVIHPANQSDFALPPEVGQKESGFSEKMKLFQIRMFFYQKPRQFSENFQLFLKTKNLRNR